MNKEMFRQNEIVLGCLFGDEGKGNVVQWLCQESIARGEKPLVTRFSGGPQCGHRVINNGIEHVCSMFGSGVLLGVPTYLDHNVFVDPVAIKNEYQVLQSKGISNPRISIHPRCRVITPYDILHNIGDTITLENGSCGCGIFSTFKRHNKVIFEFGEKDPASILNKVREYYKAEAINIEIEEEFIEAFKWIQNISYQNYVMSNDFHNIFEGSQGLLLDMDRGFMPNCTPSKVGLNGISEKILKDAKVYLVMRSYLTRHGNGYEPKQEQLVKDFYKNINEPTNSDFGYQGKFKIGILETRLIDQAISRHTIDNYGKVYNCSFNVVVTHMDKTENDLVIYEDFNNNITTKHVKDFVNDAFSNFRLKINNIYLGYNSNSTIYLLVK